MHKKLALAVQARRPSINPDIGNGIVKVRSKDLLAVLEANFQSSARSFPAGFKFIGLEKCSPPEAYASLFNRKVADRTVDLSRNSVITVAFKFELHGKPLSIRRYLQVPFVSRGNLMYIKNSKYVVSPVVANETFSISGKNVFLPVSKTKFTFTDVPHSCLKDEDVKYHHVITSGVHHHKATVASIRKDTRVTSDASIITYLFVKFGVVGTFKKYAGVDVVLGTRATINSSVYPPEQWVIYSSTQSKPRTVSYNYNELMPCDTLMVVPRNDAGPLMDILACNYFFACDEYPNQTRFEDMHVDLETELSWWKWVLNQHIYRDNHVLSKVGARMDQHIKAIDSYLDVITQRALEAEGVIANDIYDVFLYVMENFSNLMQIQQLSCLYGKKLKVKYYMCLPLVKQFNNFTFKLAEAKNAKNGVLSEERVKQCIYKGLAPDAFKDITQQNNVVMPATTTAGDCYLHKNTTSMVMQDDATIANNGKQKKVIGDHSKYLDASMLQCCSIAMQTTGNPTGHVLNPYQILGPGAELNLDPSKAGVLNELSEMIRRK